MLGQLAILPTIAVDDSTRNAGDRLPAAASSTSDRARRRSTAIGGGGALQLRRPTQPHHSLGPPALWIWEAGPRSMCGQLGRSARQPPCWSQVAAGTGAGAGRRSPVCVLRPLARTQRRRPADPDDDKDGVPNAEISARRSPESRETKGCHSTTMGTASPILGQIAPGQRHPLKGCQLVGAR